MVERSVTSGNKSGGNLVFNGAIIGLLAPITVGIMIHGAYIPAYLGTLGATGGGGVSLLLKVSSYLLEHSWFYEQEDIDTIGLICNNAKIGGLLGTSAGAIFVSVPIIITNPMIIPLSFGTMFIGGALGLLMESSDSTSMTGEYQHINFVQE